MTGIVVRSARKEDCKEIRNLMQRLAEHVNLPDGPKIDAETLEKDGFGDNPLFHGILAEENDKLIGYTLYSFQYLSWTGRGIHISDLYVVPDARNKGIGSLLLQALAKKAAEENCTAFDFTVVASSPAAEFYQKKGAINRTEMGNFHSYRLYEESLNKLL